MPEVELMLNVFKIKWSLLLVLVALTLTGCASTKLSLVDGKNSTFNIYNQKDDKREKLGEKPVYVMIERRDDGQIIMLSMSKAQTAIINNDQERIVISNNFTNIAPDYGKFNMQFHENMETGERNAYKFICNEKSDLTTHKSVNYTPCTSFLANYRDRVKFGAASAGGYVASGEIHSFDMNSTNGGFSRVFDLNTAYLVRFATENNLIEKAKSFYVGAEDTIVFNKSKSSMEPLTIGGVWLVKPHRASDSGRYLFKPSEFITFGDTVKEDKKLGVSVFAFNMKAHKIIPYEEISHIKLTPGTDARNTTIFVNYKNGKTAREGNNAEIEMDGNLFSVYKGEQDCSNSRCQFNSL